MLVQTLNMELRHHMVCDNDAVHFSRCFTLSLDAKVIYFVDKLLELVGGVCRFCDL